MNKDATPGPRVGLFVTCLVDLIRPAVGFAAVKLLEDAWKTAPNHSRPQTCVTEVDIDAED